MKKNKQSKWFALVILLCISIGAKAQMPQTPQDILNMAAGSLQFDFSGYFNGQQKQQQQQQGGMSQQNAEQVLKAMQDRERATQQRINAQQAQQQRHERQRTNKKW
jgi:hypothetical protein